MNDFLSELISSVNSPLILILTLAYLVLQAITIYDVRLTQAATGGIISRVALASGQSKLPEWVGFLVWLEWLVFIGLLIINWKYALGLWILTFLLKVTPVLETIGSIIMKPFLR